MKKFREFETVIWIVTAFLFIIGYTITELDMFVLFAMTAIIMGRISALEKNIKRKL